MIICTVRNTKTKFWLTLLLKLKKTCLLWTLSSAGRLLVLHLLHHTQLCKAEAKRILSVEIMQLFSLFYSQNSSLILIIMQVLAYASQVIVFKDCFCAFLTCYSHFPCAMDKLQGNLHEIHPGMTAVQLLVSCSSGILIHICLHFTYKTGKNKTFNSTSRSSYLTSWSP